MGKTVTIAIITYNHSKYICRTLKSVLNQHYPELELVVVDDCSVDDTELKVKKWLKDFARRFINVTVVSNKRNFGVSYTVKKAINLSNGEYIKVLGGDDLLPPSILNDLVETMDNNQKIYFLDTFILPFTFNEKGLLTGKLSPRSYFLSNFDKDNLTQFRYLTRGNFITALGMFYRNSVDLSDIFDMNYKLIDDWPAWINVTLSGNRFYFLPIVSCWWHRDPSSISISHYYNEMYIKERFSLLKHIIKNYSDKLSVNEKIHNLIERLKCKALLSKKQKSRSFFYKLLQLMNIIDPVKLSESLRYTYSHFKKGKFKKIENDSRNQLRKFLLSKSSPKNSIK